MFYSDTPKACLTHRNLEVIPVANGFLVRIQGGDPSRVYSNESYVFANAGSLSVWMETWAIDRTKERKTTSVKAKP